MPLKRVRRRRARKILSFFRNNFNFRKPYQILIDGTFCSAALHYKLDLKIQLQKYLSAEVKCLTTACVIIELESLGHETYGAMLVAKQFSLRKCGHEKNPIPASECLYSMLSENNPDHYFISTQDAELTEKVRNMFGVPLLYIKYHTVIMEKPSGLNLDTVEEKLDKQDSSDYHFSVVQKLKKEIFGEQEPIQKKKKKRKFKGELNQLSSKKKKLMQEQAEETVEKPTEKRKRRRHRVKIAKHVKELLNSAKQNEN